jgi:sodium/proline symporter
MSSGRLNWASWADILTGFGWGLGYFGMPHIIIRFMAIRSQKEVKKSAVVGISWTILILIFSVAVGSVGRLFLGNIDDSSLVFITMVRVIFPGVISGILLSAILAAAMSTADSQLLASASAFAADVYNPVLRKGEANEQEMFWAGRFVVAIIALTAGIIASHPNSGTIMSLVGNAWGVFGAAFGPVILLSLFWKRFTFTGAIAGIVAGAVADVIWLAAFSGTGLYEIIPGFAVGLITAAAVTLCGKSPGKDVEALFDKSVALKD